ncbi:UNVERIFIED_CONTAM: hypothetical protein Sradi_7128800 [Sesamum radiatum]|uniref:Uncharacterized protein n=1 Tax=Sesamum radiatum TaxID=300843 RepID=A0AAW2IY59_SESRA
MPFLTFFFTSRHCSYVRSFFPDLRGSPLIPQSDAQIRKLEDKVDLNADVAKLKQAKKEATTRNE